MFRAPWLVSYIQSSFTTTNVTSQNCRIPVPFILDLELIYLESESEWTLTGFLHRVLAPENRVGTHPTCLLHSLHTPLSCRLAEYDFKDKMIDNSRVTNFRFSYKALSSPEHRTRHDNYTGRKHWKISSAGMDENWPSSQTKSSIVHLLPSAESFGVLHY